MINKAITILNSLKLSDFVNKKYLKTNDILNQCLINNNQLYNLVKNINGNIDEHGNIVYLNITEYYQQIIYFLQYLKDNNIDYNNISFFNMNSNNNFDIAVISLGINKYFKLNNSGVNYYIDISCIIEVFVLSLISKSNEFYFYDFKSYIINELLLLIDNNILEKYENLDYMIYNNLIKYCIRINNEEYNANFNNKNTIVKRIDTVIDNPKDLLIELSKYKTRYTKEEIVYYYKDKFINDSEFETFFKKFFMKINITVNNKYFDYLKGNYPELNINTQSNPQNYNLVLYNIKKIW